MLPMKISKVRSLIDSCQIGRVIGINKKVENLSDL
jgi:hypothetical protein